MYARAPEIRPLCQFPCQPCPQEGGETDPIQKLERCDWIVIKPDGPIAGGPGVFSWVCPAAGPIHSEWLARKQTVQTGVNAAGQ